MTDPITMVGVEVAKALILLALQEARKAGMTLEEIEALHQAEKEKFKANDPAKIPEVG